MLILTALAVGTEVSAERSNHHNRVNKDSQLSYIDKLNIEHAEISKRIHNLDHSVIPVYERKIKHLCQIAKFADKCRQVQARLKNAHQMKLTYHYSLEKLATERDIEADEPEDQLTSYNINREEDTLEATDLNTLKPESGFQT